jgi:hypothetical protein
MAQEEEISLTWHALKLPANEFEYKAIPYQEKDKPELKMAFVILQGIHLGFKVGDLLLLEHSDPEIVDQATVYEVKTMVLSDLAKYKHLLKYYADPACQTFRNIAESLPGIYPHIIEGEIVTVVFFTPLVVESTD